MRRLLLFVAAGITLALAMPAAPRAAAGQAPATRDPWPAITSPAQWLMIEAEPLLDHPGGSAEVLEICRRARESGYNGLLLWDGNLWERDLPPGYMENAAALNSGLRKMGFTLMLQMCPRGAHIARWSGDETMLEPRPSNPHPREKNYRYLCLSHPGVHQVWEEQIRRAEAIYHPVGWLMQAYNEIRVACADDLCEKNEMSPGELIKQHVRKSVEMCRRVTPGREVALWNDMIDPYHNAMGGKYYHVEGSLSAAAGTVDKDVLIFSWNNREQSFAYWANRGNRQIVPIYYDRDDMTLKQEGELWRAARKHRKSVLGWMFSTWRRNYGELEAYGDIYAPTKSRASDEIEDSAAAPPSLFRLPHSG